MHGATLSTVMKREKLTKSSKILVQCQDKQRLVDIQSETKPNILWQFTAKQESISGVRWLVICGLGFHSRQFQSSYSHSHESS